MTGILIAAVGALGAVLVALIERGRRQNTREHGETVTRLDKVLHGLGRVEQKIDTHLDDHDKGTT
jgi:hypothetical protein